MDYKCDKCDKPATIHLTDIADGEKTEVHLCEDCAMAEGLVKAALPLNQLLQGLGIVQGPGGTIVKSVEEPERLCGACGLSFSEFRQQGLLGCPNDYDAFGDALETLIERAQDGATQHVGKVPGRAGLGQKRQTEILRLRGALRAAVAQEDYERAAELRDQIKQVESQ